MHGDEVLALCNLEARLGNIGRDAVLATVEFLTVGRSSRSRFGGVSSVTS